MSMGWAVARRDLRESIFGVELEVFRVGCGCCGLRVREVAGVCNCPLGRDEKKGCGLSIADRIIYS